MHYLSKAIATVCTQHEGLQIVQLPSGLDEEHSFDIVYAANSVNDINPPFAILVGGEDDTETIPKVPKVSRRNAIKYRRGDRLAVVAGSSVDLASFDNSYRKVVGPGFPTQKSDLVSIEILAPLVVAELFERQSVALDAVVIEFCSNELIDALSVLSRCYERAMDTTRAWNGLWFDHVERGLRALSEALRAASQRNDSEPVGEAFARLVWPSMGLPHASPNKPWSSDNAARLFMDALTEFWGDQESIDLSTAQLREIVADPDWSKLPWAEFEEGRIKRESLLGALQEVVSRPDAISAWAEMDRSRFESPIAGGDELTLQYPGGAQLPIDGHGSPALLKTSATIDGYETPLFEVVVGARGLLNDDQLGEVGIRVTSASVRFEVESRYALEDAAVIRGRLIVSARARTKPVNVKLAVALTSVGTASGRVAAKAEASVVVLLSKVGALAWPAKGRLGKAVYAGPENAEDEQSGGEFSNDLSRKVEHLVAVWGDGRGESSSTLTDTRLSDVQTARVAEGADFEVSFDEVTLAFRGTSGTTGYLTPLTAAATKSSVDHNPLDDVLATSVRGMFEAEFGGGSSTPLMDVLGHVVVAADSSTTQTTFTPDLYVGVGGCLGFPEEWALETGCSVSPDLLESEEAQALREALTMIWSTVHVDESGRWPSRTSWAHLAGSKELDEYLDAYAALVRRASKLGPVDRFWGSFPFSVSVWSGRRCDAVLLSPLHPIRLAWLAAAESTLYEAEDASRLAGTVEGWQFPCIGPAPTPKGQFLAVPSDAGHAQLFAAWSMMVPVSSDQNEALKAPSRALGRPAPGTSPSGLTASAAEAAMRDYLRANSHVPSLTIDLAASVDTARLVEVDEAVIATIQGWARGSNRWGVRVLDSVHRTGDLPRSTLAKLMNESKGAHTLTWSRYRPTGSSSSGAIQQRSNIRLLQDSGAEVRATEVAASAPQVAGRVPLRRFSAGDVVYANEAFRSARLAPTGWESFDGAVRAVEQNPRPTELGIRLSQSYLLDRTADWTVSGEAFLSPAAISALVAAPIARGASRGDRVLWEWRPPYLQGRHGGAIDRRAYVTVARVSAALRTNLTRKLKEVTDWDEARLERIVSDVLVRLGTEGLGLSSLLTRGGTHESGALGFYLAYELLRLGQVPGATDLVLPLDACDTFLTALGGDAPRNSAKRADLLLMRFHASEVVLIPLEIKFYGADSIGGHTLPRPGPALKEALGQLNETASSLKKVVEQAASCAGADRALWYSAFATLVESGLHLGRPSVGGSSHDGLLEEVVAGRTRLRLGQPLVMYFAHARDAVSEFNTYSDEHLNAQTYGAVIARPCTVFDALSESGDSTTNMVEDVRRLLTWAADSDPGREEGARNTGSDTGTTSPGATRSPSANMEAVSDDRDSLKAPQTSEDEAKEQKDEVVLGGRPASLRGDGIRFPVGKFVSSLGTALPEFWPSNTQLNQLNLGVVGDLGTGKTQLLQALIYQIRRSAAEAQPNPVSFLVLDYKRDFQREEFLSAVGGKVLSPRNIPLNPFELDGDYSPLRAYERAKDFCDVLERIYSGVGPVQRQRLTTAVTEAFGEHPGTAPTLGEVLGRYQLEVTADSVTSILRDFVMREIFIEDRGPTVSFEEMLEDRVVVLALNELGNDKDGKNALVALFLNQYYSYMLGRTKWPVVGRDPSLRTVNSYLLVDEAVNIMRYDFEVLENLLLQGREFGVGVMLASQFLSHFRTSKKDWAEPLLTWFIHKVPHVSVKELERIGLDATAEMADQVGSLPVHEAIYKSLGISGRRIRGNPFFEL